MATSVSINQSIIHRKNGSVKYLRFCCLVGELQSTLLICQTL